MFEIKELIAELVEIEYINIRLDLYINMNDDIKSKLSSGLVLHNNLIYAYREKIRGLIKYINNLQKNLDLLPIDYFNKANEYVKVDIDLINKIIFEISISSNNDTLSSLIKEDQDMYLNLIINNNNLVNDLIGKYLESADEESENVLQIKQLIEESNQNKDELIYIYNEEKNCYPVYSEINMGNLKQKYLFQISEIEKAISSIEEKENKSRKNINELYMYYNEIIKLKSAIAQM